MKKLQVLVRPMGGRQCHKRREGYVRARRAECTAHARARSDLDRHRRHGLDSAVGRPDRGDPKGGYYLDSSGSETLARRYAKYSDDTHRNPRNSSMAKPWRGCRRSPTNNTANNRGALSDHHIMGSG